MEKIGEIGKHKQNPNQSEIPSLNGVAAYGQELSQEELDKLWIGILDKA